MRGNPAHQDSWFHTVVAVASGFQATEVRIPCQWNLDSGFQSFAGSLIIQAGWQIPKPSNSNSTSKNRRKNSQILDSTSKGFSDSGWESGVPDMEQYTDSHWIVGTQVSAADFAGRKTKQKTDILTRIWCSKVANLANRWTGSWVKDRLLHCKTFNRFDIYWFWFLLTNKFLSCSPELLHSYSINKGIQDRIE